MLSPASFAVLCLTGAGLYLYYDHKREEIREQKGEQLNAPRRTRHLCKF